MRDTARTYAVGVGPLHRQSALLLLLPQTRGVIVWYVFVHSM